MSLTSQPRPPRSIFVLRNNDVGDVLVVTPLFAALREAFPETPIAAGVGHWAMDVLRHNPHVDEVLAVDAPWANKYAPKQRLRDKLDYLRSSPQMAALAARQYQVGIDVLGSAWGALLLLRSRIPYRLAVRGYAGGHSGAQATVPFDPCEHVTRTALRFAELLGATALPEVRPQLYLTDEETRDGEAWWQALDPVGHLRRIVVAPGGGLPSKRWPAERFEGLAHHLADGNAVTILTGLGETELTRGMVAIPRARVATPGLRQVFAILSRADVLVGNSTMTMHVAAAFAKPAVTILGPAFTSASAHEAQWGYPGLTRSLGREPGLGDRVASVDEALAIVRELLAKCVAA